MDKINRNRYLWLLANMGSVEEKAKKWNPSQDKQLLKYLQDFIDSEIAKENIEWFNKQSVFMM